LKKSRLFKVLYSEPTKFNAEPTVPQVLVPHGTSDFGIGSLIDDMRILEK
jgi:hypothetical protein